MAGEACEILTVEELHRRMGHVTPETIKQMVSNGAFEGTKIDLAATIQHCDSCEHAKNQSRNSMKCQEQPNFGTKFTRTFGDHPQFKPPDTKSTT